MFLRRTHLVLALVAALAMPSLASADATFTFTGHGYGHGVGMGQYGAQGYALQGWTHEQILAHYYQGTTLGPTAVTQVRVLLQENAAQVSASAPAGLTAARRGRHGDAARARPGRRDGTQGRGWLHAARPDGRRARARLGRARLARGERRRASDARRRGASTASRTAAIAGACACWPRPAACRP